MNKFIVHPCIHYDRPRTPEENLLIAIIARALMDLKEAKEFLNAKNFLLSEECFIFCQYLDIDIGFFTRILSSLPSQKAVNQFFKLDEYSYGRRANGFKERA